MMFAILTFYDDYLNNNYLYVSYSIIMLDIPCCKICCGEIVIS